ncbi:hypothetical protein GCM10007160_26890 [Litchfieldella qijiaojingensis]|uniref:Uncharacterized protein n=1 Tax=Litchfieldella qijiaojingensis TaxID=980347 RepID=A0ABQ2YXM9_9GAMM|nr:hypothetical protein GCM10007160_26890 [Halomonas qijiaojingensis]
MPLPMVISLGHTLVENRLLTALERRRAIALSPGVVAAAGDAEYRAHALNA